MINRIKSGETSIELPMGWLDDVKIRIPYYQESDTQEIPDQVVMGIFEGLVVTKDGVINYGLKLIDVKGIQHGKTYYFNTYKRFSANELERALNIQNEE